MTSRVRKTKMSWEYIHARSKILKSINEALRWMQDAVAKSLMEAPSPQQKSRYINEAIQKVMTDAMVEGVIQQPEFKVFLTTRQKFRYRRNRRKGRMVLPSLTYLRIK